MKKTGFDIEGMETAWCPGCGDHGILSAIKATFDNLGIKPGNLVMVSGIGQAAKIPQYFKTNYFNGLHGRALPAAVAIKAANPGLTVVAESGDGDMYGEGGNHFIHTIRRNPDITNIVHNNMVYGLTKGQASPTSQRGFVTPVQVAGVMSEPFNPLAVAIALDASFVARAFIGDQERTSLIIEAAVRHRGYALVDIFQPCPSFNKINTYKWFRENTYYLEDSFDNSNRLAAFEKALQAGKLPLGIFYKNEKPTFADNLRIKGPCYKKTVDSERLNGLISSLAS